MQNDAKPLGNVWTPCTWLLIWEYLARTFQWIPTWQVLDGFQKSLHPWAFDESSLYLGWRKEWICSERPITICPIVTCWTHARRTRQGISARSRGNKDQSGLSHRLHYRETLSPPPAGGAQSTNFGLLAAMSRHWLRPACSGWPAGFESTCLWSSKPLPFKVLNNPENP